MYPIISYLKWRGDLTFQERPFCEVDNLVLSLLAYADLSECVPSVMKSTDISVEDAWKCYHSRPHGDYTLEVSAGELLAAMADSRRFRNARLSKYQVLVDHLAGTQFGALCIKLDDGSVFISYQGTDQSIAGWKEDFCLSFELTQAQKMAADYLQTVLEPGISYRIGGHSKGGHLAEYAALRCPEDKQNQIKEVWCNDSPGLCRELFREASQTEIQNKITRIIPAYSVIGTLFLYNDPDVIVDSTADGILQHNAFSWRIEGDRFVCCAQQDPRSLFLVETFDQWIESADMEHRRQFTQDFFGALSATGATTLSEVAHSGIDGFGTVLLSLVTSESRTKLVILRFLKSIYATCKKIDFRQVFKEKGLYRSGLIFLVGMLCMAVPELAQRVVGMAAGGALLLWSIHKSYQLIKHPEEPSGLRKKKFFLYTFLICASCLYTFSDKAVLISTHLLIAVLLLIYAFQKLKHSVSQSQTRFARISGIAVSVFTAVLGIVAIALAGEHTKIYILSLGAAVCIYGMARIINVCYENGKTNRELSEIH